MNTKPPKPIGPKNILIREGVDPFKKKSKAWRLWAKALGQKGSVCSREADIIAIIRTLILLTYLATNAFIIAGVIRHW